jgi:hypothetical protein
MKITKPGNYTVQIGEGFGSDIEWLETFTAPVVFEGDKLYVDNLLYFEHYDEELKCYRRYKDSEHTLRVVPSEETTPDDIVKAFNDQLKISADDLPKKPVSAVASTSEVAPSGKKMCCAKLKNGSMCRYAAKNVNGVYDYCGVHLPKK